MFDIRAGLEGSADLLEDIVKRVLISKGKDSTGALINSLNPIISKDGISLETEDYLDYIDQGRKPGTYVPIRALQEWVKAKGLPDEAAYAIRNKIFRYGIEPVNIYDEVQSEVNRLLIPQMKEDMTELIYKELNNILNKKNK